MIHKLILISIRDTSDPLPLKPEGMLKSDPSESKESKGDRLETPEDNYYNIVTRIRQLGLDAPELDVFASTDNAKCIDHISKETDAMVTDFLLPDGRVPKTIWCNAPHSFYFKALPRVYEQYLKHDFNAVVLIPTTNSRAEYWQKIVEPNRIEVSPKGFCFYYPLRGTIYFELDHLPLLDNNGRKSHAHNAYFVLLFIKKSKVNRFKELLPQVFT